MGTQSTPHVRPHLYLKTWCVYEREALVTFVCLLTSMCHLVFLQLMYVLVCKSYHIGQTLKASRQCASLCEFAMHQRKWKCNCTVCSYVAVLLHASTSCALLGYLTFNVDVCSHC